MRSHEESLSQVSPEFASRAIMIWPPYLLVTFQCVKCGVEWSLVYKTDNLDETPTAPQCRHFPACGGTAKRTNVQRLRADRRHHE